MEKSVVKYLAEFSQRLDDDYGETVEIGRLFADADNGKLNIADDLSWLADFEKAIGFIQRILGNEHLHVKYVKNIVKVQAASRLDSEGFAWTLKEPRLWKGSDRGPRPESVYMTMFEDEYAIYENRFIKMLIDEIIRYLSGTLTELADSLGNLRAYFGSRLTEAGALRMSDEQGHSVQNADDKRVLAEGGNPVVEVYDRVETLLKRAIRFKNSTLYRECRGKPLSGAIQPTNILTKNHAYRECYLFYQRFCAMSGHNKRLENTLFDNGILRLLYATYCNGYRIVGKPTIGRFSDGGRSCKKVNLQKDNFTIEVSALNKQEIQLTTTMRGASGEENAQDAGRRYTSRVMIKISDCEAERSGVLAENYRKEKLAQGYDDAYLAVYSRKPMGYDGVINFANKGDFGCRAVEDFVRSLTMQLVGAHKIFGKRCPVCGTKCVDTGESVLSCIHCGSTWSLVQDGEEEKVWVKRIRH
ncbi:MAG: DUF2357 domain-containing protein [Clostridia bacterium]|nr:DUF2357 domain-containing protein [Clostridia bacterium]